MSSMVSKAGDQKPYSPANLSQVSNLSYLNEKQYSDFLMKLYEINIESKIYNKQLTDIVHSNSFPIGPPPINFPELTEKIHFFSVNLLFGAEAASRLKWDDLAETLIDHWKNDLSFTHVLYHKEITENNFQQACELINEYVNGAKQNFSSRGMQLPPLSDSTFERLCKHFTPVETVLFTLVTDRQMPVDVMKNFIKNENTELTTLYLIFKFFGHQLIECSFPAYVTDHSIIYFLQQMPNLEILDLRGCNNLTIHCLNDTMHSEIKTILLTNTKINPDFINRSKFPSLENADNSFYKNCNLNDYFPWYPIDVDMHITQKMIQEIQTAKALFCNDHIKTMLIRGLQTPTQKSFELAKALISNASIFASDPILCRDCIRALIIGLSNCSLDHWKNDSLGIQISDFIAQCYDCIIKTDEGLRDTLCNSFPNSYDCIALMSKEKMLLSKNLLKALRVVKDPNIPKAILNQYLFEAHRKAFEELLAYSGHHVEKNLERIMYISELFVELSYHIITSDEIAKIISHYDILLGTPAYLGKTFYYLQAEEHLLACALVTNMLPLQRVSNLHKIISMIKKNINRAYPWSGMIVGDIIKDRFPIKVQDGFLIERSAQYSGVFGEMEKRQCDENYRVRNLYYDFLCDEDISISHIEALAHLYKIPNIPINWKTTILKTLDMTRLNPKHPKPIIDKAFSTLKYLQNPI